MFLLGQSLSAFILFQHFDDRWNHASLSLRRLFALRPAFVDKKLSVWSSVDKLGLEGVVVTYVMLVWVITGLGVTSLFDISLLLAWSLLAVLLSSWFVVFFSKMVAWIWKMVGGRVTGDSGLVLVSKIVLCIGINVGWGHHVYLCGHNIILNCYCIPQKESSQW